MLLTLLKLGESQSLKRRGPYSTAERADGPVLGGDGNDVLWGGDDANKLYGGAGINSLTGGAGNDTFYLESVSDVVIEAAGGGLDRALVGDGGTGADTFLYSAGDGDDRFVDFSSVQGDKIDLSGVTVSSMVNNVATLGDGALLIAQTGYLWTGGDFI